MNDTLNVKDKLLYILVVIKPEFPFKVCNTDCIMPGFDKFFIFDNFYSMV